MSAEDLKPAEDLLRSLEWQLPCESRKPANVAAHPAGITPPATTAMLGRPAKLCCGRAFQGSGRLQLICARCVCSVLLHTYRCRDCGAEGLSWLNWHSLTPIAQERAA